MVKPIIVLVRKTKKGQKILTVPKNSDIEEGDYVELRQVVFDKN